MHSLNNYWLSLLAIPAISLERALAYVAAAALMCFCLRLLPGRWLRNRRLSDKTYTVHQLRREVLLSIRAIVIYGLCAGVIAFAALNGWTRVYFRIDQYGWTWFAVSILFSIVIHDTYFYWTHRLMHHPRLFRVMHQTHHLSTNPSPWAAYSFSVWEVLVQAGIAPLLFVILPLHPIVFSILMIWQIGINVMGHCGHELYPRWFLQSWLGCIFNTTTHHAQHHESNRVNFSLYFNIWDRLMGTNHRRYAERFAEVTQQA
jgi:lathosterol oxidase